MNTSHLSASHSPSSHLFPDTLRAGTPAEGQALASQLASALLSQPAAPISSIADTLRRQPELPSAELLSAIYFHAISIVNHGWRT